MRHQPLGDEVVHNSKRSLVFKMNRREQYATQRSEDKRMKIKLTLISLAGLGMSLGFMGCKKAEQADPAKVQKGDLVVFAQANSQDPWRRAFDDQIKEDLPKYKDLFKFEEHSYRQ